MYVVWRLSLFLFLSPPLRRLTLSVSLFRKSAGQRVRTRENGGTERPIKLTNANTSRLGSGVDAGQRDARSSIRFDLHEEKRTDAAGPNRNRQ